LVIIKFFVHFPPRHRLATLKLKDKMKYFDIVGILTFTAMVVCLLFALQLAGNTYSWSNARIIALFALSGVSMILFLASQVWNKDHALLPVRILNQRSIRSAFCFALAGGASMVLTEYYVSHPTCRTPDHSFSPALMRVKSSPSTFKPASPRHLCPQVLCYFRPSSATY
jgi:hypothetical protein